MATGGNRKRALPRLKQVCLASMLAPVGVSSSENGVSEAGGAAKFRDVPDKNGFSHVAESLQ